MANTWFVMIPPGYADKSDSEKELVDLVVQIPYPSQDWTDANSGKIVGGKTGFFGQFFLGEGDQQLVKWKGPYATEQQARTAAASRQFSANPINDATNAAENATGGLGAGLADIGKFFHLLTEGSTWIRIAEAMLGLGLIIVGLAKLASGTAAGRAAARVGKAAAIL